MIVTTSGEICQQPRASSQRAMLVSGDATMRYGSKMYGGGSDQIVRASGWARLGTGKLAARLPANVVIASVKQSQRTVATLAFVVWACSDRQ